MTKNVWHASHCDSTLIEQFRIAFSSHQRPPQALKCPIGAPWGITTLQKLHSESLRSSFDGQFFEVRKNLGGCHHRSVVRAAPCGHIVMTEVGSTALRCACGTMWL